MALPRHHPQPARPTPGPAAAGRSLAAGGAILARSSTPGIAALQQWPAIKARGQRPCSVARANELLAAEMRTQSRVTMDLATASSWQHGWQAAGGNMTCVCCVGGGPVVMPCSAWVMCRPQPSQVIIPHVGHRALRHILRGVAFVVRHAGQAGSGAVAVRAQLGTESGESRSQADAMRVCVQRCVTYSTAMILRPPVPNLRVRAVSLLGFPKNPMRRSVLFG